MKLGRKRQPLVSDRVFLRRMLHSFATAGTIIGVSLAVGILGYHFAGRLGWLDSLVNASMILGGMGPVDPITRTGGKVFASIYALYSGVALLTTVGLLLAPALHRVLHRFHMDEQDEDPESAKR
jgi:hypothetical protein